MIIDEIRIERVAAGSQCGRLTFRLGEREAFLLWLTQWRRGQKVSVEFVPGEGATREDVRAHYDLLVDTLIKDLFEQVSRKALF